MSIFGPLPNPHAISRAIRDHHHKWIDFYLVGVEDQYGMPLGEANGGFARPVTYIMRNMLESLPGEEDTPAIVVVARGGVPEPGQRRRGWDLTWDIGVACITSSFEDDGARWAAGAYAAATAGIMLQRRNIDGRMDDTLRIVRYDEIRLDDLPGREARGRAIVRQEFSLQQTDAVWGTAGPGHLDDPPNDPYTPPGDWPTVEEGGVQIDITKEDPT